MSKVKVSFFGDSICMGQGVSIHGNWIVNLSSDLYKEFGDRIIVSINAANGRTTRMALEVMPYEIQSSPPDILIIQYGMNDCNYWETDCGVPRVTKNAFRANLEEIITRARACGVKSIFLNSNHPTGRFCSKMLSAGITYEDSNVEYNEIIRLVGDNPGVNFIDIELEFEKLNMDHSKYLLPKPDLLHLNEFGNKIYYEIMKPILLDDIYSYINKSSDK